MNEKVKVKVVVAKFTNLHLRRGKRKLTVRRANEMLLTAKLVDYVKQNGERRLVKQYGYSRLMGPTYFYNAIYTAELTPEEILSLLDVNERNKNSKTYQRITSFLR